MTNDSDLSILEERELLFSMFCEITTNARFSVDKIWEVIKFTTTLCSALITVTLASLSLSFKTPKIPMLGVNTSIFFALIPILVIALTSISKRNLRREYKLYLEKVIIMSKLQERLGLHNEVSSSGFKSDKYLLPTRFIEEKHDSSERFIEENIKKKGSLYHYLNLYHHVYIALSVLLAILLVILAL